MLKKLHSEGSYLFFQPSWDVPLPFEVIGHFKAETSLQSNDLLVIQTEGARMVLEIPEDEFTDMAVHVPNPEEVETIALKIRRMFPELRTVTKAQIQRTYHSVFSWKSGFVLTTLLASLFAFLILIWDKASGLSAEEKREIGILKAIGWDTDVILKVKLWEGLILSGSSCFLGILLSYAYIYWLEAPVLRNIFIGWSTIYPSFELKPEVDLKYVMLIVTFSVVPYSAVTIFPAWKAAITDADTIMRNTG